MSAMSYYARLILTSTACSWMNRSIAEGCAAVFFTFSPGNIDRISSEALLFSGEAYDAILE
jgi:hypothetical protein